MSSAAPDWPRLKRIVGAALERPPTEREAYVTARFPDPARRVEALRLLRACTRAAESPLFDGPASDLATPLLEEVALLEREAPPVLVEALAGRYTIERELGRGGMATVYLARDERHGRPVALKLLRPDLAAGDHPPGEGPTGGAARFQREIRIAASLSHPHVLPLYDSGAAGEWLYYITPFVDGETLAERLAREGPPPLEEAIRILRDIARALAHAHQRGLVHRDVKPANILLTRDGDALVADFGVARGLAAARGDDKDFETASPDGRGTAAAPGPTDTTLVLGTPTYMAPEQASGDRGFDHRADLYALGVVAYEMLTGRPPFEGRSFGQLLAAHRSEPPAPLAARRPELPAALVSLVERLLAKRPDERPDHAEEVVRGLDAVTTRHTREGGGVASDEADREAFEFYQWGRHLTRTRQRDALLRAVEYYEQALARDSAYAAPWAAIAETVTFLGIFGHVPAREAIARARAAGRRAVELDSELAAGHAALAHLSFVLEWRWEEAETELVRLLGIYPRYPLLRMYYASYLHSVGHPNEALAQLGVARDIDPLAPTALLAGRIYVDTHRPTQALEALLPAIELEPRFDLAHNVLAHAYLQSGRAEDAVASMRRAAELSGPRDRAQLVYILARTGDEAGARQTLAELLTSGQPLELLGFHVAMGYAGLGERDHAFRWLEAAIEERGGFMNLLGVATGFESLRADPRYTALLRRMGLPQAEPPGRGADYGSGQSNSV